MPSNDNKVLQEKRHSLAHALGSAVMKIYPGSKLAIGPAVEDGFYYDIDIPEPISVEDLKGIEKKMREIIKDWSTFDKKVVSAEEALEYFKENEYKIELINQLKDEGKEICLYTSGDFTDLCGGGHAENMKDINLEGFKLHTTSGAYWRGDEKNKMLTRIYGLAFDTKEELEKYCENLEEAKNRDHRKLGKELGLFTFSPIVGSGLPLFTPKGSALRGAIEKSLSKLLDKYGYEKVWIPHITKPDLYKKSGHWDKFSDELFKVRGKNEDFVLKPMNCPHHTQIYASDLRSYNDLPIRYAEFTTVYRDEQKGELLGLSRVLSITQDDGHIFCTEDQIESEVFSTISMIKEFYTALGFFKGDDCEIFLSTRGEDREKYLGEDSVWDAAEKSLKKVLEKSDIPFMVDEGEAAFYGPKIDFVFRDSLNRKRQLATIQLDFVMPERFKLKYVDSDNKKKVPVMIHRAVSGSLERFLGILIEHFNGKFPFFLSPIQARVLPISSSVNEYADEIHKKLRASGLRVDIDKADGGVGKKIAKLHKEKIPCKIIVGENEQKDGTMTIEIDETKETLSIEEAIAKLSDLNDVF